MQRLYMVLVASCLSTSLACQPGNDLRVSTPSAEDELRRVDLDQSRFVQAANGQAVAALLHPSYTAHLPNGRTADRTQTLALIDSGALARERHQRSQERVIIAGDTGVVIGLDRLEAPPPLAQHGERTRRYTNIYIRQHGHWRLLARHFHFMP
jgi:ketosteroid isomerase-like protein